MAVQISNNICSISNTVYNDTLPWSIGLQDLAAKATRKDSLSGMRYTFENYSDAAKFYTELITKQHCRTV